MMPNNKSNYKLQKEDSKNNKGFKKLEITKGKVLKTTIGILYLTCLVGSMISIANMKLPKDYREEQKTNSNIEETQESAYNVKKMSLF